MIFPISPLKGPSNTKDWNTSKVISKKTPEIVLFTRLSIYEKFSLYNGYKSTSKYT